MKLWKIVKIHLPTNHGFLALFSTVRPRKYSSNPLTGFACGCTDKVPSTYIIKINLHFHDLPNK